MQNSKYIQTRQKIIEKIKTIQDPEININIWDLGIVYGININNSTCGVIMTFTSPNCPASEEIIKNLKHAVLKVEEVEKVDIEIVWSPAWDKSIMSDETLFDLDLI